VAAISTVERTDLMRVVVQVPEREASFVEPGNPVEVAVDRAYPGLLFKTAGKERVEVLATWRNPRIQ